MIGEALAYSLSAPSMHGALKFIGSGSHVLNFATQDDQLLSVHRDGAELSPSGWIVSSVWFEYLKQTLTLHSEIGLDSLGIFSERFRLNRGNNPRCLVAANVKPIPFASLERCLADINTSTGLYGSLGELVKAKNTAQFFPFIEQLECWFQGGIPDWSTLIGKGPGLTPSHDDMLVGILFGAHSLKFANVNNLFSTSVPISQLTTSVSQGYLVQASNGYFSQQLLQMSYVDDTNLTKSINNLLKFGHYSGSDSLLGLWLFFDYVNKN